MNSKLSDLGSLYALTISASPIFYYAFGAPVPNQLTSSKMCAAQALHKFQSHSSHVLDKKISTIPTPVCQIGWWWSDVFLRFGRPFSFSKKTWLRYLECRRCGLSFSQEFTSFLMLDVLSDSLIPLWQVAVVFVPQNRVEAMKKKFRASINMYDIRKMSLNKYNWIGSNVLFKARDKIWTWYAKTMEMELCNDFEICTSH